MTPSQIKFGIIIPCRGDRPLFLNNLQRMMAAQTVAPAHCHLIDYPPESEAKDITQRYRYGYDCARGAGLDVLFLIEVDDYYAPNYFETMLTAWIEAGSPPLFGTRKTIYYHLKLRKYYTMRHETRSSAMSTMIRPDLTFHWCADDQPYTDVHLYEMLPYKLFMPSEQPICIGIKHGVGLCGGEAHVTNLDAYDNMSTAKTDPNLEWLRSAMDPVSFEFYANYFDAGQVHEFRSALDLTYGAKLDKPGNPFFNSPIPIL